MNGTTIKQQHGKNVVGRNIQPPSTPPCPVRQAGKRRGIYRIE